MSQTGRYARIGSAVQDGDATVTRALDPVTGLPVRIYRFDADPVSGAATLRHPSVVSVLAAGRDEEGGFVVADVIDGAAPLDARPGALDLDTAAAALHALAAVHEHGVVHGDPTARRVLRRGSDVWLEGVGVPWAPASPSDDVRRLADALLGVPGHALPTAAVACLRAATDRESLDAATLADEIARLGGAAHDGDPGTAAPSAPVAGARRDTPHRVDAGDEDPVEDAIELGPDGPGDEDALDDGIDVGPDTAGDEDVDDLDDDASDDALGAALDDAVRRDQDALTVAAAEPTGPPAVERAPEPSPPTVVRRRVATSDMAPDPAPPAGPVVSRRIAGGTPASRGDAAGAARPATTDRPPPDEQREPPAATPAATGPVVRAAPAAKPAPSGTFSKTPPPDVRYRVGETPLDERPAGGGRAAGPAVAQRHRRRTWMLAALLVGALVLAVVTAIVRRPVPPPAPASGTVTSIVVDVRLDPPSLPPATLVVLSSPSGSRLSAGSALGTVPRRVVFDAAGTWQVEARFQDRRSETVTFRLPDDREVVLRFPALP